MLFIYDGGFVLGVFYPMGVLSLGAFVRGVFVLGGFVLHALKHRIVYSLPKKIFSYWFKLKAFENNKINVAKTRAPYVGANAQLWDA